MATLYVVSTPIGNLADVTFRAAEILGQVSRVLAEDTRRTRVLLNRLAVRTPLTSLHQFNEAARTEKVLAWLGDGEDLALVSDAGTPLLSDPGSRLVQAVVEAGHDVVPIPGPSAILAALVVSGLPVDRFAFLGFAPRRGRERVGFMERVRDSDETVVVFESPSRLTALLRDLADACGPDRRVAVARELTKIHETVVRGTLPEAVRYYDENPPKGEVTVVIEPARGAGGSDEEDEARAVALAGALLEQGLPPSQVAREVARKLGVSRNAAYRIVHTVTR